MKLQKKRFLGLLLIIILVAILVVVGRGRGGVNNQGKLQVTTSFYPLFYFTQRIGGDYVFVINITPSGSEPHDYELSTLDIINMEKSKLVVLNGAGFETWGERVKTNLKNKDVVILEAGADISHTRGFEEDLNSPDPHVWLDPTLAKKEAKKILDQLVLIDPINKEYYLKNAQMLFSDLDNLDLEFKKGLRDCIQGDIVTSHLAFSYLADRYGFNQISIAGLSPDSEPSPKALANITKIVKEKGIKYVFFETLVSPKLSQTVANELNIQVLSLDPLEGLTPELSQRGEDYLSIQRKNLTNLRLALQCK